MRSQRPVLLKLSGEALAGGGEMCFDRDAIDAACRQIWPAVQGGRQVAIVVGGGNIMRGASFAAGASDPTIGDYMGMLATQINALALADGLRRIGGNVEVVGPQRIANVCHGYDRARVLKWLATETVVVFGGGTGHPFLTTDTAAALRAAEIGASEVLKGSKVDGIYTADPALDPQAKRFDHLDFDTAVAGRYGVMDATAFTICRDHGIGIRVFDMTVAGGIWAALGENPPGTLVSDLVPVVP